MSKYNYVSSVDEDEDGLSPDLEIEAHSVPAATDDVEGDSEYPTHHVTNTHNTDLEAQSSTKSKSTNSSSNFVNGKGKSLSHSSTSDPYETRTNAGFRSTVNKAHDPALENPALYEMPADYLKQLNQQVQQIQRQRLLLQVLAVCVVLVILVLVLVVSVRKPTVDNSTKIIDRAFPTRPAEVLSMSRIEGTIRYVNAALDFNTNFLTYIFDPLEMDTPSQMIRCLQVDCGRFNRVTLGEQVRADSALVLRPENSYPIISQASDTRNAIMGIIICESYNCEENRIAKRDVEKLEVEAAINKSPDFVEHQILLRTDGIPILTALDLPSNTAMIAYCVNPACDCDKLSDSNCEDFLLTEHHSIVGATQFAQTMVSAIVNDTSSKYHNNVFVVMGGESGAYLLICTDESYDPTKPNRCEHHKWFPTGLNDRVLSLHMVLVEGDKPLIVAAHHSPEINSNGIHIPETRSLVVIRCQTPTCSQSTVVNVINNPQILGVQIVADTSAKKPFPIILYSQKNGEDDSDGVPMMLACTKPDCSGFNHHIELNSHLMSWTNTFLIDPNDGSLYLVAPVRDRTIAYAEERNHVVMRIDNPLQPTRSHN